MPVSVGVVSALVEQLDLVEQFFLRDADAVELLAQNFRVERKDSIGALSLAVASPSHSYSDAEATEDALVVLAGVRAVLVAGAERSGAWAAAFDGHLESAAHEVPIVDGRVLDQLP